jgi:hypothetical protein
MQSISWKLVGLLTLCVAGAPDALANVIVKGKIFPLEGVTENPVFLYENSRTLAGETTVTSQTKYLSLEGKPLVEEEVFYDGGKLKRYRYNQIQTDERGEIEVREGKVYFTYFSQGKKETDSADWEEKMIIPDMIGVVLKDSWGELMAGDSVKVRFLLLERLDTIGFKFFKDGERTVNGKEAVDIVMKASSIFIAALAPKIIITVEKAFPHRILETSGRLPVRRAKVEPPKSRKDYKAIDGRLNFEYP